MGRKLGNEHFLDRLKISSFSIQKTNRNYIVYNITRKQYDEFGINVSQAYLTA